jgi:hypothetical protein
MALRNTLPDPDKGLSVPDRQGGHGENRGPSLTNKYSEMRRLEAKMKDFSSKGIQQAEVQSYVS